jgi:hypothetical protein
MAADRLLDALRDIADGETLSIGFPVTVLTAGARIEGSLAGNIDFTEWFDRQVADARDAATRFDDDAQKHMAAEAVAKVFDAAPTHKPAVARFERRQEIGAQLEEMPADDPRRGDLEDEQKRLGKLSDVLVLRDPRIWTSGYNPLQGPLTPPFVRIPVAQITGWWMGHSE